eukprot:SAG31_NODE_34427_length_333_cov_0.662393_1_plen_68_part_10
MKYQYMYRYGRTCVPWVLVDLPVATNISTTLYFKIVQQENASGFFDSVPYYLSYSTHNTGYILNSVED